MRFWGLLVKNEGLGIQVQLPLAGGGLGRREERGSAACLSRLKIAGRGIALAGGSNGRGF